MKGTKKPRMFVFIYVCGVCVSVYVCIIYIYEYVVIGSVWHSWQVADVILLGRRHGLRGVVVNMNWVHSSIRLSSIYSIPCTL